MPIAQLANTTVGFVCLIFKSIERMWNIILVSFWHEGAVREDVWWFIQCLSYLHWWFVWNTLKSISQPLCVCVCVWSYQVSMQLVRYSVPGTVWWVFGTSASIAGGTEVLGYHRGVPRYALGGRTGVGGESTASCINYTGKNPPRTHKNYQLAWLWRSWKASEKEMDSKSGKSTICIIAMIDEVTVQELEHEVVNW